MKYPAILMAAVILGISSFVFAQTSPLAPATADMQRKSSDDVRVSLEMRWVALNDNFVERIGACPGSPQLKALPKPGGYAACDAPVAESLVDMVSGDTRSSVGPVWKHTMLSGDGYELPFFGPAREAQGRQVIQASVAKDRRAFQIRWTRNNKPDGEELSAALAATVPLGKHLLIHTHDGFIKAESTATLSFWDRLLMRKPRTFVSLEKSQVFLLVTPQLASEVEKGEGATRTRGVDLYPKTTAAQPYSAPVPRVAPKPFALSVAGPFSCGPELVKSPSPESWITASISFSDSPAGDSKMLQIFYGAAKEWDRYDMHSHITVTTRNGKTLTLLDHTGEAPRKPRTNVMFGPNWGESSALVLPVNLSDVDRLDVRFSPKEKHPQWALTGMDSESTTGKYPDQQSMRKGTP